MNLSARLGARLLDEVSTAASLSPRLTLPKCLAFAVAGLVHLPRGVLKGLRYLSWHESQRAEYLADYLAARAGGTEAAIAKLGRQGAFNQVVHRLALNREEADLFAESRDAVAAAAAIVRDAAPDPALIYHLDATHPPGEYRIRFLRARPAEAAHCIPSAAQADQLEQELLRASSGLQQHVLERYRRRLYR